MMPSPVMIVLNVVVYHIVVGFSLGLGLGLAYYTLQGIREGARRLRGKV